MEKREEVVRRTLRDCYDQFYKYLQELDEDFNFTSYACLMEAQRELYIYLSRVTITYMNSVDSSSVAMLFEVKRVLELTLAREETLKNILQFMYHEYRNIPIFKRPIMIINIQEEIEDNLIRWNDLIRPNLIQSLPSGKKDVYLSSEELNMEVEKFLEKPNAELISEALVLSNSMKEMLIKQHDKCLGGDFDSYQMMLLTSWKFEHLTLRLFEFAQGCIFRNREVSASFEKIAYSLSYMRELPKTYKELYLKIWEALGGDV